MDIAGFLARTRHIRFCFPHEDAYRFSESADTIISRFCEGFSIPRSDIVFYPAYTSRASPELIRLNATWYIVWDYHFAELIHSFNITTLTLLQLDAADPAVAAKVSRDSVVNHFSASLFRFLSCQFFRRPHISVALADAFAQLACELRPPIRRDLADRVMLLRNFQWSYVLNHELAHIYFASLSEQERKQNFDRLGWTIEMIKDIHGSVHHYAKSHPEWRSHQEGKWWSGETDAYERMLRRFSEKMVSNFDRRIAEEIVCDTLALQSAVIHWCLLNDTPFDFEHSGCVSSMELVRSAANALNNFRLVLEVLRSFWEGLAQHHQQHEEQGWSPSVIGKERKKAASVIQEVFLRGSMGMEAAWYATVASALGQSELRLDNPQLLAHMEKSMKERETGECVEGFDETFTRAWHELQQVALALMEDEVVDMLFETVRQKAAELSPQQALQRAQKIIEW